MRWLEQNILKRLDPSIVYPEARSVIVCALNYFQPESLIVGTKFGKISRYAWGKDYYSVIRDKLVAVLEKIQLQFPEITGRCFVDTAPMMEKYWTQEAGIGWQAKHSLIISPLFGSWIFLGVILINHDLFIINRYIALRRLHLVPKRLSKSSDE